MTEIAAVGFGQNVGFCRVFPILRVTRAHTRGNNYCSNPTELYRDGQTLQESQVTR